MTARIESPLQGATADVGQQGCGAMFDKDFPAIMPSYSGADRCDWMQQHTQEMRELLRQYVPASTFIGYHQNPSSKALVSDLQGLRSLLPLVKWEDCQDTPGVVTTFLLCPALHPVAHMDFFVEMVGHWSVPGKHLSLLASRHLTFRFPEAPEQEYFAAELSVLLESDKDLSIMRRSMGTLVEEIRLGVSFVDSARRILEAKGLTADRKRTLMQEILLDLIKLRPEDFESDVFEEMQHFMLNSAEEFTSLREVRHLCRIVCAHYRFRKDLERDIKAFPRKRHVRVRLCRGRLHYPFGIKTVMGVVISLNFLRTHELLEERHVLKAIERCLPGLGVVPESFFTYRRGGDSIRSLYLEVEKLGGDEISLSEAKGLSRQLPEELSLSVEQLVRSVVMRRNEEEVFQNILLLAQELKYVDSAPQVVMSYHGQTDSDLMLNVILVRVMRKASRPLEELLQDLPDDMRVLLEQVKVVGRLRKRYPKQANVFTFQINKDQFLRQDHSIDLYKARRFVLSTLAQRLGPLRDYNGGLIWRQTELLDRVKEQLGGQHVEEDILLDDFFHSITPVVMQSLLTAEVVCQLYRMFKELLGLPLTGGDRYHLRVSNKSEALYLMVYAEGEDFRRAVYSAVESMAIPDSSFAMAQVDVNGAFFMGCVCLLNSERERHRFQEVVSQALQSWLAECRDRQRLRLTLSRNEPVLDPRMGKGHTSGILIQMLYEGLHRVDFSGKPAPAIASSVQVSNDQCLYTFKLRQSKWSNGLPVTAHDFDYAWRKILDPASQARFSYLFYPIKNARAVKEGKCCPSQLGIRVRDDHTLAVELEHPAPYFLELTAHWTYSPLCREVERVQPGWAHYGAEGYVCNGPFQLAQWGGDHRMKLKKNAHYWDARQVKLEEIDIAMVEDPHLALTMFEHGELDWVGEPMSQIPLDALPNLQRQGVLGRHPVGALYWYEFNTGRPPFHYGKMRRAFGLAVNRRALIQFALNGYETPARSVLAPNMALHPEPLIPDGDVGLARELFAEALTEMGLAKEQLPSITISYCHQETHDKAVACCVAKQWEDAFGVEVRVEGFERSLFNKAMSAHDFQVLGGLWLSWHNDPIYTLEYVKYRDQGINVTQWEHPEYVRLLDKSNLNLNADVRRRHLQAAEKLLMEEMPLVPLYYYHYHHIKREHVKDVLISDLGQIDFKWAQICHHS